MDSDNPMKDIDLYGAFTVSLWASGCRDVSDLAEFQIVDHNEETNREARNSLAIMALGAAGETGEVVEHIKKLLRDGKLDIDALKKELGDMVYYWARICRFFGFQPSDVIETNVEKLESRKARGVIRGSGDNR